MGVRKPAHTFASRDPRGTDTASVRIIRRGTLISRVVRCCALRKLGHIVHVASVVVMALITTACGWPSQRKPPRANANWCLPAVRPAFSLVELLVVLAIVAVLISLLLPALGAARTRARRTACRNNLRQIGMGLQSYHASQGAFPPGGIEWRPQGNTTQRQLAWSAFLLPFVDEQPLYATLNLDTPFDSPENAAGAAKILPLYVCPSSIRGARLVAGRGPCDYGGIFGERITSPNNPPKGTLIYDKRISIRQIEDGTSNTLMVAEDSQFADGQWINGRNVFDQAFAINAAPNWENDIRSEHFGGALAARADGSVVFLADTLELKLLAALCTRAGHEVPVSP